MNKSHGLWDSNPDDVNVKYTFDRQKRRKQLISILKVFAILIHDLDCWIYILLVFVFDLGSNHQQEVNDHRRLRSPSHFNILSCTH